MLLETELAGWPTHLCCCFKTGNVEGQRFLGSRCHFKRRLESHEVLNEQSVFCPSLLLMAPLPDSGLCPPMFSSYPLKLTFRFPHSYQI